MKKALETGVLIAGAGTVGLTLAIDLAWRGVDVILVERRRAGTSASYRCNQISARSMEIYRRLGVADRLRDVGIPAGYPNDVVSATSVTGIELARIKLSSQTQTAVAPEGLDSAWPTPELSHRVNQFYFEPLLFAHAAAQPKIQILTGACAEALVQNESSVVTTVRDVESGELFGIKSSYLVGCDGAKSTIRKEISARFIGDPQIQRAQTTCIRAPKLIDRIRGRPAWMYFSLNPRRCGTAIAVDGQETWLVHNFLYRGELDHHSIDRDWAIRTILGVEPAFRYDVVSQEDWIGRRLVADRFRDRRAFICGDAAHVWMPHAGYGMNAGIADAADLAWLIAAVLNGWAEPSALGAYEAERQPVAGQTSQLVTEIAERIARQRRQVPVEIEWSGPIGDAVRARSGEDAFALDRQQQLCAGLNFGYFYGGSPLIAYDGEPAPAYTMGDYTPATAPGCRVPHFWPKSKSLYDVLGPDYTLMRLNPRASVSGLVTAAAQRRFPLAVLDVDMEDVRALYGATVYRHALVLVRPDQHVAWRGNEEPAGPLELIDLVRGARPAYRGLPSLDLAR